MNTDNCQHLTKYRLFAVMRIPICLLAIILAGSGMATAQVSPFVEYGATVHTGDNTPLWQVSNQQGLGSIYDNYPAGQYRRTLQVAGNFCRKPRERRSIAE